jgi:hypothetical protein
MEVNMATSNVPQTFDGQTIHNCELAVEKALRRHFPTLQPSRNTPQFLVFPSGKAPYHWQVRAIATNRVLSRHRLLAPAMRRAGWLNKHRGTVVLPKCEFESAETGWGAGDGGFTCYDLGTVHHLESERDLCYAHFLQAEL